jgi:hypothetical protein
MDTVKERAFGAVFKLDRIYAYDALLIFTECAHHLGAYLSLIRPCRASSGMSPTALSKFPAFHIEPPFHQVFTKPITHRDGENSSRAYT